jgi:hypothetical protein
VRNRRQENIFIFLLEVCLKKFFLLRYIDEYYNVESVSKNDDRLEQESISLLSIDKFVNVRVLSKIILRMPSPPHS